MGVGFGEKAAVLCPEILLHGPAVIPAAAFSPFPRNFIMETSANNPLCFR